MTLVFEAIAREAGFLPDPNGKLNLPATQATADNLALAATVLLGDWKPGDDPTAVALTGPGPVWGYLAIAHALHGRCVQLTYSAPNAELVIWRHGTQE